MREVHWIVYSDFLCPWCFNAAVRLRRLESESGGRLRLEWRSFLLRPQPRVVPIEKFCAYTETWLRPAAEDDAGTFRVWASEEGPPSHSVPPHVVAKAAAELDEGAGRDIHERLLQAYFQDNRNITDRATLAAIWREAGLASESFESIDEERITHEVFANYQEAMDLGITGVPAVRPANGTVFVTGAQPYETYRRWFVRLGGEPC